MLMFGDYVKSRAALLSKTPEEVVQEELDNYPYGRKDEYIEPYFTPVDLSNTNPHFTAAVTGLLLSGVTRDLFRYFHNML